MGQNANGTATCDRCGILLPGYGIINGIVCTDLTRTGAVVGRIFCYRNNCRTIMLTGMLNFPATDFNCVHCNRAVTTRSLEEGMLTAELHPGSEGVVRSLLFCYANDSRDLFLANVTRGI